MSTNPHHTSRHRAGRTLAASLLLLTGACALGPTDPRPRSDSATTGADDTRANGASERPAISNWRERLPQAPRRQRTPLADRRISPAPVAQPVAFDEPAPRA